MTKLIEEMANAAVHYGHKAERWNPRMAKYIYGKKNGIHVFDLNTTFDALNKALEFVKRSSSDGKRFLIVSTKPQSTRFVVESADSVGMDYVVKKWIPGLLTNFKTLKKRIDYLRKLKKMRDEGEFDKYTKKETVGFGKEIDKLEAALGGVQGMEKTPDVVIVLDVVRDMIAVEEARKLGISVVGICDSNANPSIIDFPIPGNDDSIRAIGFFIKVITSAIAEGKTMQKKQ